MNRHNDDACLENSIQTQTRRCQSQTSEPVCACRRASVGDKSTSMPAAENTAPTNEIATSKNDSHTSSSSARLSAVSNFVSNLSRRAALAAQRQHRPLRCQRVSVDEQSDNTIISRNGTGSRNHDRVLVRLVDAFACEYMNVERLLIRRCSNEQNVYSRTENVRGRRRRRRRHQMPTQQRNARTLRKWTIGIASSFTHTANCRRLQKLRTCISPRPTILTVCCCCCCSLSAC